MKRFIPAVAIIVLSFSVFTVNAQTINTVAGSASYGYSGDGGPATAAKIADPIGVIADAIGNLYIGDYGNNVVRKVNTSGIISTFAGTGVAGYNSDNIQATAAEINGPGGLGLDAAGNVYIAELSGARIRKVDVVSGIITTVAGTGAGGFGGDGGQATDAQINFATDVKFDNNGNFYIADEQTERVREVSTSGIINTIAGNGSYGYNGDGGPATAAEFENPTGVAIDPAGNVYIGDQTNSVIRVVNTSGIISTFAGNGLGSYSGDGGPATAAELNHPEEVFLDAAGNVYIDDEGNSIIRMVNTSGIISTVVGIPRIGGFSGDGGPATAAEINGPQGLCLDKLGNIYIGDYDNSRVREVTSIPTATNNIDNISTVIVYPNPAKEELNIDLVGIDGKVIIALYNIQGQQILNQEFTNQQIITINTVSISTGMYILKVKKEDGTSLVRKVEIQK